MTSLIAIDASEHPLKSVTVFKSNKAEVVRTFVVALEKGQNKVEIRHLPRSIDTDSVRVTGLGDAQLFDVVCSIDQGQEDLHPESTPELVRRLTAKKLQLAAQNEALNVSHTALKTYSATLVGEHVPPEKADAFIGMFLKRTEDIGIARMDLDEQILQLTRQIGKLERERAKKRGTTKGVVTVVVMTQQATEVELKLTYIVHNATWIPTYELHAMTEGGMPATSVSLHYRARVTQSTGEDWTDVALTISTAEMDLASLSIPELRPTRIRPPPQSPQFYVDRPRRRRIESPRSRRSRSRSPSPLMRMVPGAPPTIVVVPAALPESRSVEEHQWDSPEAIVAPLPLIEATSVVKESPLSVYYSVDGKSSVPSDGLSHQVSIATLPFEADVMHVVVPKAKAITYLLANVKNASDFRLMPGPVNVFVDDSFVSKTLISEDITPGDTFKCTLGTDSATRIRYSRTSAVVAEPISAFSEQFSTTTFTSRVVILNRHAFDLSTLIVRDALPVSDDEKRVSVVLRQPSVLAQAKEGESKEFDDGEGNTFDVQWTAGQDGKGGQKEGLFEWVCKVGAGKEITLETVWDVKAPANVQWIES
ncbi:hypothetical protein BV25DRAFT_1914144 [Artomyces pyxidatus]|uniref:Uncharacterized protein n=1 Tax=Artomyces pyxidatus TaxID=48021 RepID=A0ACB8T876_9AGAM|nr:hypothetical protein BV25DRAFT_1914144 [Artomyces pyxidatus]